jgi:hypothetical protein
MDPVDLEAMEAIYRDEEHRGPPLGLRLETLRAGGMAQWVDAVQQVYLGRRMSHVLGEALMKAADGRHARLWLDGARYKPEDLAALGAAADQLLADPELSSGHRGARKARAWVRQQSAVKTAGDARPVEALEGAALTRRWQAAIEKRRASAPEKVAKWDEAPGGSERTAHLERMRKRAADYAKNMSEHEKRVAVSGLCVSAFTECVGVLAEGEESLANAEIFGRCASSIPACPRGIAEKLTSSPSPCCPRPCRAPMQEAAKSGVVKAMTRAILSPPCTL